MEQNDRELRKTLLRLLDGTIFKYLDTCYYVVQQNA